MLLNGLVHYFWPTFHKTFDEPFDIWPSEFHCTLPLRDLSIGSSKSFMDWRDPSQAKWTSPLSVWWELNGASLTESKWWLPRGNGIMISIGHNHTAYTRSWPSVEHTTSHHITLYVHYISLYVHYMYIICTSFNTIQTFCTLYKPPLLSRCCSCQ